MKIANWNIERLKHKAKLNSITNLLEELNADILVLTETDSRVQLSNYKFCFSTPNLIEIAPDYYLPTENRVSIYTNFELVRIFETYDKYTALCVELKTELGNLIVYGTIIGIYGNRHENFKTALSKQLIEFDRLSAESNFCVIGDYNISFSDNYYFTSFGRDELKKSFSKNAITILTKDRTECIDHIAISENFLVDIETEIDEWNYDKKLSDHKGIWVDFKKYN